MKGIHAVGTFVSAMVLAPLASAQTQGPLPALPSSAPSAQPAAPPPGAPPSVSTEAPPVVYQAPAGGPTNEAYVPRQVRTAENAIFIELGGNGLIYSLNYEHIFGDSDFSVRAGLSLLTVSANANGGSGSSARASFLTFPLLGNYYIGGRDHKLQLGFGLTLVYVTATSGGSSGAIDSISGFVPAPTAVVGYRYLPAKGGFSFSIGFTPFIIPGGDRPIFPWAGLGLGAVF